MATTIVPMNATSFGYQKSLDGLRAFAVFIVLIAHAGVPYPRSGGLGVDIFFALSGFLITTILFSEYQKRGTITFKNFFMRRILRLVPCLVIVCASYWLLHLLFKRELPTAQVLYALTYTSNWARALYDAPLLWLDHTWSLAIEEQFYLLWPCLILLVESTQKDLKRKFYIFALLAVSLSIYRYLISDTYSLRRIYFGLDTHMDGLVSGAALAYWFAGWRQGLWKVSDSSFFYLSRFLVPMSLFFAGYMIAEYTWQDLWMARYGYTFSAILSILLITDLMCSNYSLLKKIFELSFVVYIGKISYGLYLWHIIVYHLLHHIGVPTTGYLSALIKIIATIVIASISYQTIERYFLNFKKYY